MKKVIFVVEGQTEQVFIQRFIEHLIALKPCHISLEHLHGDVLISLAPRGTPIDQSTHHIRIIDVANDDKVISFIDENIENFKNKGFEAVYGLRDRYPGNNQKVPINSEKVDAYAKILQDNWNVIVEVVIAVEEIEAWFLCIPQFFEVFDKRLTLDAVNKILDFDPANIPIESVPHPSAAIDKVLSSVGMRYKKRLDDSHKISDALDYETLYLEKTSAIPALKRFVQALDTALT